MNREQLADLNLDVTDLKLVGDSVDYPITPKDHGIEFLIDNRHLWIKITKESSNFKVRHQNCKSN